MAENIQPRILDGKYAFTSVRFEGGMSEVTKGITLETGMLVAIKTWLPRSDSQAARESLIREAEALNALRHPNIIKLLEFIREDDQDYLILEWLETDLHKYIQMHSPLAWDDYYSRFGRPLIEAVSYAHRQQWTHRDITPRNILIATDGSPRLVDYGISKQTYAGDDWQIIPGKTFRDARTLGYSPTEPPVGIEAFRRDCYSLGAVACYAVSGIDIASDEDLRIAYDAADFLESIRPIISRAISYSPEERFPIAGAMLEAVTAAEDGRRTEHRTPYNLFVSVIHSVRTRLTRLVGDAGHEDVEHFLTRELNEDPFCILPTAEMERKSSEEINTLDIFSPEWKFRCRISGIGRNRLEIVDAIKVGQTAHQRIRDDYTPIPVLFSLSITSTTGTSAQELSTFLGELQTETLELAARTKEYKLQSLYNSWRTLVREQSTLSSSNEGAIRYNWVTTDGDRATFQSDELLTNELLDQRRFVQSPRGRIYGKVVSVFETSVVLDLLGSDGNALPSPGSLEVDTNAAERAAATQIAAIDRVQYGDSANLSLPSLLVDPTSATPPQSVSLSWAEDEVLDASLRPIVEAAAGAGDVYVVEGPPGTGKTTLIARLIEQYLLVRPNATVLLTSQTHIAVDNVVKKLLDTIGEEPVVRIGHLGDQRIDECAQDLLLSRRVAAWAELVQQRAYSNLVTWASDAGLDVQNVEAGIWIERILKSRGDQATLERQVNQIQQSSSDHQPETDDSIAESSEAAITELRSALRRHQEEEKEARKRLRVLGSDAASLSKSSDYTELEEWKELFFAGSEWVEECRQRFELLEGWFQRLGRGQDFHLPMLSEASVIAGTCVAVGGVRGIDQIRFDLCIVDEASKATVPEILIPMVLSGVWVLIGDPKQLPPFFDRSADQRSNVEVDEEARRTILDRFLDPNGGVLDANKARLSVQHRMIRAIGDLVSNVFYDGSLVSRYESHGFCVTPPLPTPVTWFTTSKLPDRYERKHGAYSFQNVAEVRVIQNVLVELESLVRGLQKGLQRKLEVAVIAGYIGQVRCLNDMIRQNVSDFPHLDVTCNSVDSFQGQEADVCIYFVTRSNRSGRLGFLREKPRLNVALSRGRSGLVIVGDHRFCRSAKGENPFDAVVSYIEDHCHDCSVVQVQC